MWWEKTFATRVRSDVSADGCYRLEYYKPYWIVPNGLHPLRFPEKTWNPLVDWYGPWEQPDLPRFYRVYDHRSGKLLVETAVYDLAFVEPGYALRTNDWYVKANGAVSVYQAADMRLPCPHGHAP